MDMTCPATAVMASIVTVMTGTVMTKADITNLVITGKDVIHVVILAGRMRIFRLYLKKQLLVLWKQGTFFEVYLVRTPLAEITSTGEIEQQFRMD